MASGLINKAMKKMELPGKYSGAGNKPTEGTPSSVPGKFTVPRDARQPSAPPTAGSGATAQPPAATAATTNAAQPTVGTPATPAAPTSAAPASPSTPATAPTTPAATPAITPVTSAVNQATDTVQGQVESIIKKDSPLMEMARTRAAQGANSRGLLNSSMAVQAGEAAVIDAAMPMASQDASTYARNRELNQGTQNEFLMQGMRDEFALKLTDIEHKNQRLLQTSQSAANLFGQTSASISAIMSNPDIPAKTKNELIAREYELLQNGLAVAGGISGIPSIGSILKFSKSAKKGDAISKLKPPAKAKAGDIFTDENGKKFKFITFKNGLTDKGEWKPA